MTGQQNYAEFLKAKVCLAQSHGFDVALSEISPILKPHQRDMVAWAVSGGRRALFAAFGLGKTVVQLEAVRLTLERVGGRGLIVLPLQLYKLWRDRSTNQVYDFTSHLSVTEVLDHGQRLPATFMLLPPHSNHPDVWTDVARMRTLNGAQHSAGREMHLCPLQFDIVDRLVIQFSMKGETVFDPFAGIGTVPLRALQLGRQSLGVELNPGYYRDAVGYLEAAERELAIPSLFDLLESEEAA